MTSLLSRSHGLAKATALWSSALFGVLVIISWVLLFAGSLTIDIELDGGVQINAYLLVALLAAMITLAAYGISFIVLYASLFIFSFTRTR